jgi:hypothetical protein
MSQTTLSEKRSSLQTLLKATTAEKLHECLLSTLPNASATQIDALLALVGPLAAAASNKLHCVRCQESFYENANHRKACSIPHHDDCNGERTRIGDDAITITESCCGIEYDMEEGPPTAFCIVAAHTTASNNVAYYDELEYEGNRFVVTCAANGCSKRKKPTEDQGRKRKKRA